MSLPRFLADEDLRFEIVLALRRLEPRIEIVTTVESDCSSLTDPEILQFAHDQRFIVVSHDVNTMKASAEDRIAAGDMMRGLFLVLQSRGTRPVVESLYLVWSGSEAEEWVGHIVYLPF